MAKISFSYLPFDNFDPVTKTKVGEVFKPFITIRVQVKHGPLSFPIDALADSGADRNLFPMELATQILKLNLKKAKKKIIRGIGNSQNTAYTAKFKIWVNNNAYETEADFSSDQKFPILGRDGFFSLFKKVIFDETNRFTELEM